MDSSPAELSVRMPLVLSLVSFFLIAPFSYFFLRETSNPPVLTDAENFFLIMYASLSSGYFLLAYRNLDWIKYHLPSWLSSYGKRFALYMVVALALTEVIYSLPLPDFYINVMRHTVYLFCLPIVLPSQRGGLNFLVNPVLKEADTKTLGDKNLILRPRISKGIFVFGVSIVLLLGGVIFLNRSSGEHVLAWICISLFGLSTIAGISLLIPGCSCLILDQEGFVMVNMWRRYRFCWPEVSDFAVVNTQQGQRVGWNCSQNLADDAPLWRKRMARRTYVRRMCGRDALLGDDYGVPAQQLCSLMSERKANLAARR
jgi:hypothetical protein